MQQLNQFTTKKVKKMANIENLLKMVDHLRNGQLAHDVFDFSEINGGERKPNGCGTLGCAMGEMPAVWPEKYRWSDWASDLLFVESHQMEIGVDQVAMNLFDIDEGDVNFLFYPGTKEFGWSGLPTTATRHQVADHIENWTKANG